MQNRLTDAQGTTGWARVPRNTPLEAGVSQVSSALIRAARFEPPASRVELERVAAEERRACVAELQQALGQVPEVERAAAAFRALAADLEPAAGLRLEPQRLAHWAELASAARASELARVLRDGERRLRELEVRLEWLARGTSPSALGELDPKRDSDRIHHHLSRSFRAEARVVETLAINRVATWESLSLFLRSTREAEQRPLPRFLDTYALFANYFEWGENSPRGAAAVRRINQIHGRYYLPNEGMKYVLLNTAFTWLDGIDRIGHRPLSALEREGFVQAYLRLGRAMHITDLEGSSASLEAWFRDVNRANAVHTSLKTETFETFVGNSFGRASDERDALLLCARVAMDDDYRTALGYAAPAPGEVELVRAAVRSAVERVSSAPGPLFLRSLERTPFRPEPAAPAELGVGARSAALPVVAPLDPNAGYPEGQLPVSGPEQATPMALPVYAWSEIRRHRGGDSIWIVLDGEVYDVSGWLQQHPGGAERLLEWAGRDASAAFRAAAHSRLTQVLRLNYRVGCVLEPEPPAP